jgi:hypothetical protein
MRDKRRHSWHDDLPAPDQSTTDSLPFSIIFQRFRLSHHQILIDIVNNDREGGYVKAWSMRTWSALPGSQGTRQRRRVLIAAIALAATLAAPARAQTPSLPTPTPPSDFASVVGGQQTFVQPTEAVPSYYPGNGPAPTGPIVEMGLLGTMTESLFGDPDPNTWRPLPLSTFFSEGWNEAWVPSPNGSGGAPRQGWINAMDGNLYRLWFFTFAQGFNRAPAGNAYLGAYTLMAPLSRRLELIINVPFYVRNNAVTGLPVIGPSRPRVTTTKSHSGFGDISFTPRVLLHETKDFSLTGELAITTPTGNEPLAGKSALTPALGFWNNFADGFVLRGGLGFLVPLKGGGSSDVSLISQLAIGQTITPHDVPLFGDFTYYLSAVANTSLNDSAHTSVTLTPGIRTHLGNDWYFLAGLPVPVTKDRVAEIGMIFWFMKAW